MRFLFYWLSIALLYSSVVNAQSDRKTDNWTGELIVGKKSAKEIQFGRTVDGLVVNFEFKGHYPQKVREDKDGWLKLFDGYKEGWAKKEEFILSKEALSYFTDRINANSQDSFAWWMRGTAWRDRGEYTNAIKDFSECIRIVPNDSAAYNSRAVSRRENKEYDLSIKDCDEAIRLNSRFTLAYVNRALAWGDKKEHEKAIADYNEAIRLDPKLANAFCNRGREWYDMKQYDKAIADFDEAVRIDPKYTEAILCRGFSWREMKQYKKAIADFNEVIRLDPQNAEAFGVRGWCRYLVKDYDRAMADFDNCLKLDPKDVYATGNRGLVYALQKKYSEAKAAFDAALALNDTKYSYYEYAEFLASCPDAKFRDGKKAVELAKKSLKIQGNEPTWEAHAALAAAYAEVGDFELAVSSQRAALDDKTCTGDDRQAQEKRLELYRTKKPYRLE